MRTYTHMEIHLRYKDHRITRINNHNIIQSFKINPIAMSSEMVYHNRKELVVCKEQACSKMAEAIEPELFVDRTHQLVQPMAMIQALGQQGLQKKLLREPFKKLSYCIYYPNYSYRRLLWMYVRQKCHSSNHRLKGHFPVEFIVKCLFDFYPPFTSLANAHLIFSISFSF